MHASRICMHDACMRILSLCMFMNISRYHLERSPRKMDANMLAAARERVRQEHMRQAVSGSWREFDIGDGLRGYMFVERGGGQLVVIFEEDIHPPLPPPLQERREAFVTAMMDEHDRRRLEETLNLIEEAQYHLDRGVPGTVRERQEVENMIREATQHINRQFPGLLPTRRATRGGRGGPY